MSHHLYQTEGIVLGSANIGESNRYYHIFTKDLGLVMAFAQGVRELKSKLRYHLQDFSYLSIDLIRGKDTWRVTSADTGASFENIFRDKEKLALFAAVAQFLKRLLHGEERNEPLFDALTLGLHFLEKETFSKDELKNFELLIVAKILHILGYWGGNGETKALLESKLDKDVLEKVTALRPTILGEVNRALTESQL
ncbi:MAG: DNA repair protein RecO [Patescibacteria group bacterium]